MKSEFDELFKKMGTCQQSQVDKERTWEALQVRMKRSSRRQRIIYPLASIVATALIFVMLSFLLVPNTFPVESEKSVALQQNVRVDKMYIKLNETFETFKAYSLWQKIGTSSTKDVETVAKATEFLHAKEQAPLLKSEEVEWGMDLVFVLSDGTEQQWKWGYIDQQTVAMDMQSHLLYIDDGTGVLKELYVQLFNDSLNNQGGWRSILRLIGMFMLAGNAWLARVLCRYRKEEIELEVVKKVYPKSSLWHRMVIFCFLSLPAMLMVVIAYMYNGIPRLIFMLLLLGQVAIILLRGAYLTRINGDTRNENKKKVDRWATVIIIVGVLLVGLGF